MSPALTTAARPATAATTLKRILGVGFGLAVTIGTLLGIAILRTPGLVAGQLASPPVIVAVWSIGGIYTLLGAACLVELGTMLPQAGGYYVYARHAFGDTVGFAVGWTDWLTYCAVAGYVSIGMGEFVAVLLPSLGPLVRVMAVLALMAFVALQWTGLRISGRFQEVTCAVKFGAFLLVVLAGFAYSAAPGSHGDAALPAPSLGGFVIALESVVIAYGGWQSALYFTEEDRDPTRNLRRSMLGGIVSVMVVYLLVNVVLLRVLPMTDLARSTLPAADAARILMGTHGRTIITVLSLLSLPPLLNAIVMIGTRILFAMGRDGMIWRGAAFVNDGGTPVPATLVTTAVALLLIATGTFQKLVAIVSFFLAMNYFVCCLALVILRRREPDRLRPVRAWGYPWSAAIVLIGAAAFLIGSLTADPVNSFSALALLVAGLLGRALYSSWSATSGSR